MKKKQILTTILISILLIGSFVWAWTPPGNIIGRNYYNITNFTNTSGTYGFFVWIHGDGSNITGVPIYNSSYQYWDNGTLTITFNDTYATFVIANVSNESAFAQNLTGNLLHGGRNITDVTNLTASEIYATFINATDVFIINDITVSDEGLHLGTTETDIYIYFYDGANPEGEYLSWVSGDEYFEFTGRLVVYESVNTTVFYQDDNVVCDASDNCAYISDSEEGNLMVNESQYCNYTINETERSLFVSTRNDTYEDFVEANVSSISNSSIWWYNLNSPLAAWTSIYNSSYQYWDNGTLMETYNSTYDAKIANVVEDTTPQLGGNLDANAFNITVDSGDFFCYDGATCSKYTYYNGTHIITKS